MEYDVTLQPSGKVFVAHKNETILEAALRAGHNLKYQCDNGTCGGCKVRLLAGEINKIKPGEFVISEAEREQGYFLPCAHEACSDLVIEAGEYSHASDMPYQEILARTKKIEQVSPHIFILQLRTPRTKTLRFLAGQSVVVKLPDKSTRTLQVASCPCNGMQLEFHISCREPDPFTEYLTRQLAVNDEVSISGPVGDFVLDEDSSRPLLFVAYDTGFAGVKSLIEHAIALELEQDIFLLRISCEPGQDYLHNVCRSWSDAIDNLYYRTYEHCMPMDCDEPPDDQVCGQFQRFLEAQGDLSLSDCDIYLSGLDATESNLGSWLIKQGVPENRLKMQQTG